MRDVGDGPEKISDQEERNRVRGLGRRVFFGAVIAAVVATAAFVLLP